MDVKTGAIALELPQTGPARSWGVTLSTASALVFFGVSVRRKTSPGVARV